MFLPLLMIIVWTLARAAAQPQCDPITQYEDQGHCCLKCEPGTSMSTLSSCEEPQCKECGENEYQEQYTTATKCEHQEYCDPNKNFKWRTHQNKKKRVPCMCEDGFHCSSKLCLTCVPHRKCPPGSGARSIGNHTHDTVCETCPDGQFSSNNSWNSVCQKWKVCEDNFHVYKEGTGESDVECGPTRSYLAILAVVIAVVILVVVLAVGGCFWKKRSKQGYFNVNSPVCHEAHPEEMKGPTTPGDAEIGELSQPVEDEHEPSLSELTEVTSNGNIVVQETGKADVLSRQESQTDTTRTFSSSSVIQP